MILMADNMRDMSRHCQRGMSRFHIAAAAGIIPHMVDTLKDQILSRVEQRLERLGITANAAGIASGYGKDLIRDWRRSKGLPRLDSLMSLAPILKTTPDWLAFGTPNSTQRDYRVPVVSWVAASAFAESPEALHPGDHPMIFVPDLGEGRYIALEVKGDSMDRVAPEGSTIIVSLDDQTLIHRKFYIFVRENEATFKRYMTEPERIEPFSYNSAHEAIPISENTEVLGRVTQVLRKL